jgi:hypothetical protein
MATTTTAPIQRPKLTRTDVADAWRQAPQRSDAPIVGWSEGNSLGLYETGEFAALTEAWLDEAGANGDV